MTRTAISPRLAMSTLENTSYLSSVSFGRAKAALEGTRFADLRHVERTGSTNEDLAAFARAGGAECALVADHQNAGRGRLDRRWEAPPGSSLLMSVLVRPPFPAAGPGLLQVALAVAAVDALDALAGLRVGLKWPNDVVEVTAEDAGGRSAPGRKLGGLLAEFVQVPGSDPAVVLGIGLNLAWPDGLPEELAAIATTVEELGGRPVDRGDLVAYLLTELDRTGELATSTAACADLLERYRDRCVTLGAQVRVELPAGHVVGTAAGVAADGALVVIDDGGAAHTVTAGDVVHLRPAE